MTTLNESEHSFDRATDSVMIRTMEGRINSWNRSAVELYGWSKDEAVGRISHDLLRTQFPKPLQEIESELVRNRQWQGKLVHTTRDGAHVVVQSRWTLDRDGQPRTVVEINARASDREFDSEASIKADDILPKIAAIVLAGGAFLCLFVFFHYMYHYGWTGERQFINSISKVFYYYAPLGLAGFLFASLRFKPSYKINLALICVSLAVSVFGIELFIELTDSSLFAPKKPVMALLVDSKDRQKDAAEITKKFGVQIDTRTASEVIADFRKQGVDTVPIVTPANNLLIDQPDGSIKSALNINGREVVPLAGVSNKVTLLCNENGQWIDYRSDQRGFNNPNQVWQSSHLEIAALGDSFAHGYCVPADKNFVALSRQRYPAILNLGVAGDGPLLMLATLKEYLPLFKPKIVLWFYYQGNDLTDLQTERKSALLRNYLQDGFTQREIARQSDIDRAIMDDLPRQEAIQRVNWERKQTERGNEIGKIMDFAKLAALRQKLGLVGGVTADDAARLADLEGLNMKTFRDVLSQAKRRVDAWGGQLYFVYLPEWARYSNYTSWGKTTHSRVFTLVRDLGISIVDIDAAFQAHGDPLSLFPFREVGHYNEIGHRLVAEEVLRTLRSNNRDDLK